MFRSTQSIPLFFLRGSAALAFFLLGQLASLAASPDRSEVVAKITARAENITGKPPDESRYAAQNCVQGGVPANSPLWESVLAQYKDKDKDKGLPVQDCSPTRPSAGAPKGRLTGRALLLLPTAAQAAEWIVSACEAQGVAADDLQKCAVRVFEHVNGQNNLQFVVAGVIHEPKHYNYDKNDWLNSQCKKTQKVEVLYTFLDGITVQLVGNARTSYRSGPEADCKPEQPSDLAAILVTEPERFASYGRVAGLRRDVYRACMGGPELSDDDWRSLVRTSFIEAWGKTRYSLMEVIAKAATKPKGKCKLD